MDLYRAIGARRMTRNFTVDPVEEEVLDRVLSVAFRAPSAGKTDFLDLVVLRGAETQRYWEVTLPDPSGFRWQGLLRAPVLVVPYVEPEAYVRRYAEPDKQRDAAAWAVPYWWVDGGMSVEHVLLACEAEGLGACFFGQFDHEGAVRQALGVPEGRRALGTIALGWPAPDEPGRSASRRRTRSVRFGGWSGGRGDGA
jgi:nitroreductase